MALFKAFKGTSDDGLDLVPHHEGYIYLVEDEGKFYVDISGGKRIVLNAGGADFIVSEDGTIKITVEDLLKRLERATTVQYEADIASDGWEGTEGNYTYTLDLKTITCGSEGADVSPLISYKTNREEYSKVDTAEATRGVGIVFTASEKPGDFTIIIQDR